MVDRLAARLFRPPVVEVAAENIEARAVPVGRQKHHQQHHRQHQEKAQEAADRVLPLFGLVHAFLTHSAVHPHTKFSSGTAPRGALWAPPGSGPRSPEWRGCPPG